MRKKLVNTEDKKKLLSNFFSLSALNIFSYILPLLTLPYLWIIFLVLLINIIQQGIKHTNKGYKLNPIMLLSITIILSSILGTLLFYNGIGYQIDNILNNNSPRIHKLMNHHARTWSRPNKGFLSGEIIEIYSNSKFNIIDLNKKNWVIMLHEEYSRNPHNLFVGQRIRILGKPKNNKTFMAWKIMPLNFRGCPLTKIYKEKIIHKRLCPILKSER